MSHPEATERSCRLGAAAAAARILLLLLLLLLRLYRHARSRIGIHLPVGATERRSCPVRVAMTVAVHVMQQRLGRARQILLADCDGCWHRRRCAGEWVGGGIRRQRCQRRVRTANFIVVVIVLIIILVVIVIVI